MPILLPENQEAYRCLKAFFQGLSLGEVGVLDEMMTPEDILIQYGDAIREHRRARQALLGLSNRDLWILTRLYTWTRKRNNWVELSNLKENYGSKEACISDLNRIHASFWRLYQKHLTRRK